MIKITSAQVNELRKTTGAGMMDCKKALQENEGDFEKAIEYLRKTGQKLANKRADKSANEGFVIAKTNAEQTYAAVMMINCETDFVAKNQGFIDFSNTLIDKAIEAKPKNLEEFKALYINGISVEESITEMVGKIGEKMELPYFEMIESPMTIAYNHHGNRLATIIGLNKANNSFLEAGRDVAMQVAAMNPIALDKENVSKKTVEKEIEIGKEQARLEGKPEQILEKIAQGKLNKFFKDNTLLNQAFIKDTKITVKQFLQSKDSELNISDFKRLMLAS